MLRTYSLRFGAGYTLVAAAAFAAAQLAGSPRFRVHTIDVGQGLATLVEFRCGAILIDTGKGPDAPPNALKTYLDRFFELRPDLNKALEALILTHDHADHTDGASMVVDNYTVKRLIHNGIENPDGSKTQKLVRHIVEDMQGITIREMRDDQIDLPEEGYRDVDVDPVSCDECDPDIRLLNIGRLTNPGWPNALFKKMNDHSLVVKITLGGSSMIVTGDLEEHGIETMLETIDDSAIRASALTVGHHGSHNATTDALLLAMAPKAAVISCGKWNDNRVRTGYDYGHPRKITLDRLSAAIARTRTAIDIKAATAAKTFVDYKVKRAIYLTPWDGSRLTDAYADGRLISRKSGIQVSN